jgi:hypothetical protein
MVDFNHKPIETMKKLFYVGLIVLGTLSLPSCGGETKTDETTTTADTAVTAEPATVDTPAPVDTTAAPDTTKH